MDTITLQVSTRQLREQLSDVLGRVIFAQERIGVTRNGKLAAVVISVEDVRALEAFELQKDIASYRAAKLADDGTRISLEELLNELNEVSN